MKKAYVLIQRGGGTGPMKPGSGSAACSFEKHEVDAVPIPAGAFLADKVRISNPFFCMEKGFLF